MRMSSRNIEDCKGCLISYGIESMLFLEILNVPHRQQKLTSSDEKINPSHGYSTHTANPNISSVSLAEGLKPKRENEKQGQAGTGQNRFEDEPMSTQ